MREPLERALAAGALALAAIVGAATDARTEGTGPDEPVIGPVSEYLMDRDAEIALARTAAPESLSREAEVLVLGPKGYETAAPGTNGFVCYVERGWTSDPDDPAFSSAKVHYPICFNPPAARSYLPITLRKTALALARPTKAQMFERLKAAFDKRELPTPEPGSMCYMMSKDAVYTLAGDRLRPHLMFFVPPTSAMAWGADLKGSPVIVHQDIEDRLTVFVVPVGRFSDGSEAPSGK